MQLSNEIRTSLPEFPRVLLANITVQTLASVFRAPQFTRIFLQRQQP